MNWELTKPKEKKNPQIHNCIDARLQNSFLNNQKVDLKNWYRFRLEQYYQATWYIDFYETHC